MTVEKDIINLMLNDTDISNLVGDRIWPMRIEYDTYPCITLQRISTPREGRSKEGIIMQPNIQINIFAETYPETQELGEFLQELFEGYTGTKSGRDLVIFQTGDNDQFETDTKLHHKIVEIQVNYGKGIQT